MKGIDAAAARLADAIAANEKIVIVADYDADGATACAVGVRGLGGDGRQRRLPRAESLRVRLRPHAGDRRRGRSDGAAADRDRRQRHRQPRRRRGGGGARHRGADHRPSPSRRDAAGARADRQSEPAGLRVSGQASRRRRRDVLRADGNARAAARPRPFRERRRPTSSGALLDLVALGTVADVVCLDRLNRTLVRNGLARIRAGRAQPGVLALFAAAGRDPRRATCYDLGFVAGPRLNAAGRLSDMAIGIRCLLADTAAAALPLAAELDRLNRERRDVEATMQDAALAELDARAFDGGDDDAYTLCLYDPRMASGRGRHRRGPAQGSLPSPADRLRARRQRRTERLRPVDRRLPSARRARPRRQARARVSSRSSAATRMPRDSRSPNPTCRGLPRRSKPSHASSSRPRSSRESSNRTEPLGAGRACRSSSPRRMRGEVWGQGFPGTGLRRRVRGRRPAHRRRGAFEADARSRERAVRRHPLPPRGSAAGVDPGRLPPRRQRMERNGVAAARRRVLAGRLTRHASGDPTPGWRDDADAASAGATRAVAECHRCPPGRPSADNALNSSCCCHATTDVGAVVGAVVRRIIAVIIDGFGPPVLRGPAISNERPHDAPQRQRCDHHRCRPGHRPGDRRPSSPRKARRSPRATSTRHRSTTRFG